MLKKILLCAAFLTALMVSGCGEEKILGSPDKAVLAYAETFMTGESPEASAAGFSNEYTASIRNAAVKNFINTLEKIVPLSDETAQQLSQQYFDKLKGSVTFKATLKAEGASPVVELTATPIDYAAAARAAVNNDELMALLGMVGQLKADGVTNEQLKTNQDVQALAARAFGKYLADIPFQAEKTFEVSCSKVEEANGTVHWAPSEGKKLIDFLTGQE